MPIPTDRERQQLLLEIFASLLDLTPEQQQGVVDRERVRDPDMARQLEELIRHHERAAREPWVVGPYRVVAPLPTGGPADVLLAVHPDLPLRLVVVKWARKDLGENLKGRVRAEGRIMAGVRDPGVVRVLDAGTFQDRPYVVLEYEEATPLA